MTSISGSMSVASMMSPNDRMKLALQAAVSTGSVKSTDQSALSGALDDIDAAMKSSGPSAANTSASAMKTKVDGLIDKEVTDGKLTDDQATELKSVFADAASKMGGPKGTGGPGGPGGPPPPPPSDDSGDDTTTSSTDTTKSAIEQMIAFLKQLEQTVSSSSTYGSTGTSTASNSTSSSVLIDSLA
jgi:hypothetical protein